MDTKINKATCASISVTGYIGSITVKEKEDGKITVFLRVATHRKIYVDDQPVDKTDWHNAVAYGNIAKTLKEYGKKGDSIILNGDLEEWNFNEEGNEINKLTKDDVNMQSEEIKNSKNENSQLDKINNEEDNNLDISNINNNEINK